MIKYIMIVICLLIITTPYLSAGTRDPNVPDSKYLDFASKFVHTGTLTGNYDNDNNKFFGASAVAIDDHHILTAAHVVNKASACYFTIKGNKYCISEIIIHEDFNDNSFGVCDIAIGYSEEPFGLDFYPKLYTDNDEVGKLCSISGYGFTGTFNTGANTVDGKKRAGSNTIDRILENLLICSPSNKNDSTRTTLEFLIASGDSGGPLYINGELAGINSCVMAEDKNPNSSYTDESGHTRISKFINWINKNKKR
jgi:hypothetical protein